jgi:hypothetical protein
MYVVKIVNPHMQFKVLTTRVGLLTISSSSKGVIDKNDDLMKEEVAEMAHFCFLIIPSMHEKLG